MLLPSDVARLVLGYLQQEKLLATCRAFILESSDLKEYAEHCTGEGFIPACLLSLFGKNLITILNEYIAMKSKEATNDVPAMMSSLWKKLDYTLSQIRSMQNSGGFSAHQRSRTRSAIADMKKQKCLQQSASSNLGSSPAVYQPEQLTSTAMTATQIVLKPIISSSLAQTRLNPSSTYQGQIQESQINTGDSLILVSALQERKFNSSVLSPGKRKSDSQKKRSTASSGPQLSNCSLREFPVVEKESSPMEEESEQLEIIDGDLPQMIIENAREKILSNKCLQEKLAENINKFLGSDGNMAQTVKQAESGPTIQESSIDEFLGLQQGEIHMTEEAIQEILEQTESDPAFQGLFDIFDFGKTKNCRNVSQGIPTQNGTDNSMLMDEENLEALESYIGTKELDDNSHESLSYTDDHSKEACVLKTDCSGNDLTLEQHLKIQTVVSGEFSSGSEVPMAPQLRTPPRTNGLFAMNPPMSPNFSQGSAIIIASPVQPVLQGMVGMIPISIMGQNGNAISDPSRQILHMPFQTSLSSGGVPKLPLPPKSHRIPRSKSNGGKPGLSGSEPVQHPGSRIQRIGNSDKNIELCIANKKKKDKAEEITNCLSCRNGCG
ncbi:protein NPAT [Crotalus adamanteus]|uniref:Protein NPAT n=1 Tax=Crotalus adamanteus TaxID=8729 RepID=A0AAW1BKP0_CROAD